MEDLDPMEVDADVDLPGMVHEPSEKGFPDGYRIGVTRYADVILSHAFPQRWAELIGNLEDFYILMREITVGGGGRAQHTRRHDDGLYSRHWQKHRVTIEKRIDGRPIYRVRNHEIDVYAMGDDGDYPGIAVEMEWNNKDPFFHRDLANFATLHREGVIAVGVIVTRGPRLQDWLEAYTDFDERVPKSKYGRSTTHWEKLIPMVNVGGGGECPLILIGIEPERVIDWPTEFKETMS